MKRKYELLVLFKPDVPSEKFQVALDRIQSVVNGDDGDILVIDNWGKKKLAYEVQKNSKGVYVLFTFLAVGRIILELERILRLNQDVMKFLSVMVDDKVDAEKEVQTAMELNKKRAEDEARREAEEAERAAAVQNAVAENDLKKFDAKEEEPKPVDDKPEEEPKPEAEVAEPETEVSEPETEVPEPEIEVSEPETAESTESKEPESDETSEAAPVEAEAPQAEPESEPKDEE